MASAGIQPGRKDARLDAGRTEVVHQHGDAGNGFKSGAAEGAARGKCSHKEHLVQFAKNRYRNYNEEKAAFPAEIAAKSAQSVQKSGQKRLTEKVWDSTIKKIIELSQTKDEKDSQRIGRLRTRIIRKEALGHDAFFLRDL